MSENPTQAYPAGAESGAPSAAGEAPAYGSAPGPTTRAPRAWHRFDPLPLVVGIVLVVAGVTYAGADVRGQQVHEGVLGTVVIALLALAAFAAVLRGVVRRLR